MLCYAIIVIWPIVIGVKLSKCEQKTLKKTSSLSDLSPNVALTWDLTSLTIPWSHGPIIPSQSLRPYAEVGQEPGRRPWKEPAPCAQWALASGPCRTCPGDTSALLDLISVVSVVPSASPNYGCFRMLQDASGCFRMLQDASGCFRMLDH